MSLVSSLGGLSAGRPGVSALSVGAGLPGGSTILRASPLSVEQPVRPVRGGKRRRRVRGSQAAAEAAYLVWRVPCRRYGGGACVVPGWKLIRRSVLGHQAFARGAKCAWVGQWPLRVWLPSATPLPFMGQVLVRWWWMAGPSRRCETASRVVGAAWRRRPYNARRLEEMPPCAAPWKQRGARADNAPLTRRAPGHPADGCTRTESAGASQLRRGEGVAAPLCFRRGGRVLLRRTLRAR